MMWNDDITFCQEDCERMDCPRNSKNIHDRTIPHSFSVEIPQDCLKAKKVGKVMSDWDMIGFAPQGWQCPICKRVYSPMTPMCWYCGNGVPYTVSNKTVGDAVMKAEKPEESR